MKFTHSSKIDLNFETASAGPSPARNGWMASEKSKFLLRSLNTACNWIKKFFNLFLILFLGRVHWVRSTDLPLPNIAESKGAEFSFNFQILWCQRGRAVGAEKPKQCILQLNYASLCHWYYNLIVQNILHYTDTNSILFTKFSLSGLVIGRNGMPTAGEIKSQQWNVGFFYLRSLGF